MENDLARPPIRRCCIGLFNIWKMTDLITKILKRLGKDALILIILIMGGYIYNIKSKEKDVRDLEAQVALMNKIFYLQLDVDSLKQK
jgi:hypothetical protein